MITLADASSLVALINRKDKNHQRSAMVLTTLTDSLVTTEACLAEAFHLLGKYGGWPAQQELRTYIEDGLIAIHVSDPMSYVRMFALMKQYRDVPMDFGDASLVVAAEAIPTTRIFTFDSDFYIYRIHGKQPFDVIP